MYFCVNEFEVGVNNSIFSGNEQKKSVLHLGKISNFFNGNLLKLWSITKFRNASRSQIHIERHDESVLYNSPKRSCVNPSKRG